MNTKILAAIHKSESIRKSSSSGGVFYAIAKRILENDGFIFGAAFDENWGVRHKVCKGLNELNNLMQSKYVQSNIDDTFNEAKRYLENGRKVLFCGTPCQIYGLLSFLGKEYDNLIALDFICHGVPSQKVWSQYLDELKEERKITNINFRDKTNGWRNFSLQVCFDNEDIYQKPWKEDFYMRGFINNLYLRPSCYVCNFKGINRQSDITLADFWGVHEIMPEMHDDKGTSIVMVHSVKGLELLEKVEADLLLKEVVDDSFVKSNSAVISSVYLNTNRKRFFSYLDTAKTGISKKIDSLISVSILVKIKRKLNRIMKVYK